MLHCAANYAEAVVVGQAYFYRWLGDERGTVLLWRDAERWFLEQSLGPGNSELSPETRQQIRTIVNRQLGQLGALCFETYVAGTPYYRAQTIQHRLRTGDPLELRREPGNPHDPRAIEVLTAAGEKLGYVPRVRNRRLSELMDSGETVVARLTDMSGSWYTLKLGIRQVTGGTGNYAAAA